MAQILTIQKSQIRIFEGRLSHKSSLFEVTPYIESLYIIWNGIHYEPFFFPIPIYQTFHNIFVLQKSIVKSGCNFIEKQLHTRYFHNQVVNV